LPVGAIQIVVGEPLPPPIIDNAVADALGTGFARVTVQLIIADEPAADHDRRQAIAAVQDQVLAQLVGTQFHLARRPASVPFLTLEIGREALQKLAAMHGLVARVYPDSRVAPRNSVNN
ncbi:MAG: hypothetical protein OEN20_06655, partial [Gammaproteobacteria bacterium]|nr:hypothetical protein [Gammaproteobacteria bacterium]